jgi:hypothetical protein
MQIYKSIYLHILFLLMGLFGFDIIFMDVGSIPTSSKTKLCTHGRVVEGTGLIIHFRKNITGSNPVGCSFM